jgi:hypothetical protein
MRGYLQRIATAAVNARPRVHPFVDSMYAAGRREESAGPVVLEEKRTVAKPADSPVSAEAPRAAERSMPETQMQTEPARKAVREEASTLPAERKVFRPLLPERAEETPVPGSAVKASEKSEPAVTRAAMDRQGPDGLPVAAPRKDDEPQLASTPLAAPAWNFQPLIVPGEAAPRRATTGAQPAFTPQRREAPQAGNERPISRRTTVPKAGVQRPLESGSDDIQIHIGRIEVTAVQPPAPRPAPAPTRKAMSLDEYLRGSVRGDGGRA